MKGYTEISSLGHLREQDTYTIVGYEFCKNKKEEKLCLVIQLMKKGWLGPRSFWSCFTVTDYFMKNGIHLPLLLLFECKAGESQRSIIKCDIMEYPKTLFPEAYNFMCQVGFSSLLIKIKIIFIS